MRLVGLETSHYHDIWECFFIIQDFLVRFKFSNFMGGGGGGWCVQLLWGANKVRGLSERKTFLAITYFCSSYMYRRRNKQLKLFYVCYLVVLLIELGNNPYIESIDCGTLCFQKPEKDPGYVGWIGKKILKEKIVYLWVRKTK